MVYHKYVVLSNYFERILCFVQVMANPEDNFIFEDKTVQPKFGDPDVERVRRFDLLFNVSDFLV